MPKLLFIGGKLLEKPGADDIFDADESRMLLVGVIDDTLANITVDVGAIVLGYHLTVYVAAVEVEAADMLIDGRQR
jgi:hypothetical protein